MGCKSSTNKNDHNNNYYEDYNRQKQKNNVLKRENERLNAKISSIGDLKKENERLNEEIKSIRSNAEKLNQLHWNDENRGGSVDTSSSQPTDTIIVSFEGEELELKIKKKKDNIAKILTRFSDQYQGKDYKGNCYLKNKRLNANTKYSSLKLSNGEILRIE